MRRKRRHRKDNSGYHESPTSPITAEEVRELLCGKLIYQIGPLYDQYDNIVGKSMIVMENFYETCQPEEEATKWSLLVFDDGRLMISAW